MMYNMCTSIIYIVLYSNVEDISRSTDEVRNRQMTAADSGEREERRLSGHKRSRSEGSTAASAITMTTNAVTQPVEEKEAHSQQTKREREVSPFYTARPRKGEMQ